MEINVYWSVCHIMEIREFNGVFYNKIDIAGIYEAHEKYDFPLFYLKGVNVISDEFPLFVRNRIFDIEHFTDKKEREEYLSQKLNKNNGKVSIHVPNDKIILNIGYNACI